MASTTKQTEPKKKRGRPRALDELEPFHVRVGTDQRARWRASVAACAVAGFEERDESKWTRSGLDRWAEICDVAIRAGIAPSELVARMLQQHERSALLVAQLEADQATRALTVEEDRIFRALAPAAWEQASWAGALTLPPSKRRPK